MQVDKVKHTIVSFFLTMLFYFITVDLFVSSMIALAIGILKEVIDDSCPSNKFDTNDIIANVTGIIIAMTVITCIT